MSNRIIITKAGFNCLTETDPTHIIFSSDYNSLKTVPGFAGSFQQVVNANSNLIAQLAHGLSINPLVLSYFQDTDDATKYRIVMSDPSGGAQNRVSTNLNVMVSVDTTNAYWKIINNYGVQKTVNVYYEIFYEGV